MIGRLNAHLFWTRIACNLLPLLAFSIAYLVRFAGFIRFDSTDYEPKFYFGLLILTTVVWAIVADHYQLASGDAGLEERGDIRRVVLAYAMTHLILFSFLFFYRVQTFSRVFLVISAALLLAGAATFRTFVVRVVTRRIQARGPVRLLIIGADVFAARVAAELTEALGASCRVVGFVRLPGEDLSVANAPVFAADRIDRLAADNIADEVVLALAPSEWPAMAALAPWLQRMSAPVRLALDFGAAVAVRDRLVPLGALNLLSLSPTPLDDVSYLFFKRVLDVLVAGVALLFTAPLMLAIAAAIKLSSRGPVLFVQQRVGLNGKLFTMYKFRTMHVASSGESDTHWTRRNDARCTRLGALLRRTSLDELPQFFNVLKGDMSVVGPRPERPHFVRQFLDEIASYNARHRLKVGITGWAQVNGLRGDTSIPDRVQYDLYYLQNWSLALDLRIMAKTIWGGLFGKNAY
jgi:Undecaprenyl-phosphate glucose phosphotransferase